jgi:hypothetical protein
MLQASCDEDPAVDNCVLPVNANIVLSNVGVGQITEAHVSIDIFANNATSSSFQGIWHNPKDMISTVIRVILPVGYYVCQQKEGIIFSTLQGGPNGVRGLTGSGGLRQVIAEPKGRIVTEPRPGVLKRTGDSIDSADPCQPLCKERVFEMETFHVQGCELLADGNTDACRPTTSAIPGNESRITFTIANVRNPETRSRNAITGVHGELDSAAATGSVQFGVQIFKKVIEIRNGNRIPRLTMRYYNNRINDRQLNSSIFTWFDRTPNRPVILRENNLWNASVSFESAIKNELTTAVVHMHIASIVPYNGFIRIVFPVSFLVLDNLVTSVEVWTKSANREWLRPFPKSIDGLYVYHKSEFVPLSSRIDRPAGAALYRVLEGELYELFQESGLRALQNPVVLEQTQHWIHGNADGKTNLTILVTRATISSNHELMVVIDQVRTPERLQTLDFLVLTGSDNVTSVVHDKRVVTSFPLGPNVLRDPLVQLTTYEVGAESVFAKFSFKIVNRLWRNSTILVRLPLADFRFEGDSVPALSDQNSLSGPDPLLIHRTQISTDKRFWELTLKFPKGDGTSICGNAPEGDLRFCFDAAIRFDIGGFKNRRFAGPSTEDIYIETRGSTADQLEVLDKIRLRVSSDLVPSNLYERSLGFPARVSGRGDIAVTFSINNPVKADSEITLRFSALFQISPDTRVLGIGDDVSWECAVIAAPCAVPCACALNRSNDKSILALPAYDWVNQDGFNEITIYRRFVRGHRDLSPGSNVTIMVTNVQSPRFAVTPQLHITTFFYGSSGLGSTPFKIDSSVFTAGVLLPALMADASISLSANNAGDMNTVSVRFTILNGWDAAGRMTVEFPPDFDLTDARVAPTELPTTLVRATCDANLQCLDNTFNFNKSGEGFWNGSFTLEAHESFLYDYDSAGNGVDGGFSGEIRDPADCTHPVHIPNGTNVSNSSLSCRAKVLSLRRTERVVSAIRFPAVYSLTSCSRSAPSDCSQICNPLLSITTNCTQVNRHQRWTNVTESASYIPANALLTMHIKGVRNPSYSSLTREGSLVQSIVTVRTLLPQGLAVDGNDDVALPDVQPAEMLTPGLALKDSRAFNNTHLMVKFNLSNPLPAGGSIRVTFPISASFSGTVSQDQIVRFKSTDGDEFDEDLKITSYVGNVLMITRPAIGVSIKSASMLLAVRNRPGASGDSGAWKVETIVEAFNLDSRIVEHYDFAPVPITTANFRSSSVTVLSLAGDFAASPKPIAGRAVYVRLDLEVNQQIALQDNLFLRLSDGIILPAPPAEVLVTFDCGNSNASASSCSAGEATDTCAWIETAAVLSEDRQTLTLSRRQWSLLVPPRGTHSQTGEKLSFIIHGAMARKTEGPMSPFTITHEGVTQDGPRPFEIDTLSPSPYEKLETCLLEKGDVRISQNSSAANVTITTSFVLCHDLAAGDLIGFVFDRFYGCDKYFCDAHDQADAFSVAADSSIAIVSASISGITFHSYSQGTGFSLRVPVDLGQGTHFSLLISGLRNPMAMPGTRHKITVETQEASSKAAFGRAASTLVPSGGFMKSMTPVRLLTFSPGYVSSACYLSGTVETTYDIVVGMGNAPGYIIVTVPDGFAISGPDLALTTMTINGNLIFNARVPHKVDQDKIHLPLPDFVQKESRITFKISGITTAAYAHLKRNKIAMSIISGDATVSEFVDGFQLAASQLHDVAYVASNPFTSTPTELSFGMTLTREMSFINSIEVHLNSLFTFTSNNVVEAVKFKSSAMAPTDPLAGLEISSSSGNSDILVWVEPDGKRFSMGVAFTAASDTQPDAGTNSFKITGAPAAGTNSQKVNRY